MKKLMGFSHGIPALAFTILGALAWNVFEKVIEVGLPDLSIQKMSWSDIASQGGRVNCEVNLFL
jgi:hypothetical protein